MRTESKWQISLVCVVLMALLIPVANAEDCAGEFLYIDDSVSGPVDVNCVTGDILVYKNTVNLLPGAHISTEEGGGQLLTSEDAVINIHGGTIDNNLQVYLTATVTVYGSSFETIPDILEEGQTVIENINDEFPCFTLKGTYEGGNGDFVIYVCLDPGAKLNLSSSVIDVTIDIKPDSVENTVNLGSMGVIPVGILSTADFDATQVDPWTVELAGSGELTGIGVAVRGKGSKLLSSIKDLNGDGLLDLEVKVETENLDPGQFQDGPAILTGKTYDGLDIQGSDVITIVPVE